METVDDSKIADKKNKKVVRLQSQRIVSLQNQVKELEGKLSHSKEYYCRLKKKFKANINKLAERDAELFLTKNKLKESALTNDLNKDKLVEKTLEIDNLKNIIEIQSVDLDLLRKKEMQLEIKNSENIEKLKSELSKAYSKITEMAVEIRSFTHGIDNNNKNMNKKINDELVSDSNVEIKKNEAITIENALLKDKFYDTKKPMLTELQTTAKEVPIGIRKKLRYSKRLTHGAGLIQDTKMKSKKLNVKNSSSEDKDIVYHRFKSNNNKQEYIVDSKGYKYIAKIVKTVRWECSVNECNAYPMGLSIGDNSPKKGPIKEQYKHTCVHIPRNRLEAIEIEKNLVELFKNQKKNQ